MRRGIRVAAPLLPAAFVLGASFGVLALASGFSAAAAIVMSATTFAGSAQVATVSVLGAGGGIAAAVVAALLLNARYAPIGMTIARTFRGGLPRRFVEAQLVVDESWAIAQRNGRVNRDRLIGAGLVLMASWTAGTVAGVIGGGALGDPADYGLDAMFPALFLALVVGQLDSRRARVAAVLGALIALVLTPLLPPGLPIVAAAAGAIIAAAPRFGGRAVESPA